MEKLYSVVFSFLYFGMFLLGISFFSMEGRVIYDIDPAELRNPASVLIQYALWLILLLIVSPLMKVERCFLISESERRSIEKSLVFICGFFSLLLFYHISGLGLQYSTAYSYFYESPLLALTYLYSMTASCFLVALESLTKRRTLILIIFSTPLLFSIIILGNKDALVLLFGGLMAGLYFKGLNLRRFSLFAMLASTALLLVPIVGALRAGKDFTQLWSVLGGYNPMRLDGAGPYATFVYANTTEVSESSSGLFASYGNLVPSFFWSDRPLVASERFILELLGSDYSSGVGMGFSPFTQSLMIFGGNFFFLGSVVFVVFWRFNWAVSRGFLRGFGVPRPLISIFYVSLLPYFLVLTFRSDMLGYLKNMFFCVVLLLLVLFCIYARLFAQQCLQLIRMR